MRGYLYLGLLITLIFTHTGAFFYGKKVEGNARDEAQKELIEEKIEEGKKIAKENYDVELGAANKEFERKLDEAKRNVKIVREVKTNTVYLDPKCDLPAGGMQLWNDEARGRVLESTSSKTDGEMPSSATRED